MKLDRAKVEAVIKSRLEPLFALDGGSVEVEAVDSRSGVVSVRFTGAYHACPSREVLLSRVVEPTLKHEFPQVTSVKMS